ncbi:MAG: adenylate/guanylate cyclase domain-containing protein [Armatimonadetes bacterium]|nr:adenylate/guanylate cyclase domain-containing protein [Armatimonadota bacterium]
MKLIFFKSNYTKKQKKVSFLISLFSSLFILFLMLVFFKLENFNIFDTFNNIFMNYFFRTRLATKKNVEPVFKEYSGGKIAVIEVDENSLTKLGTWPIPRSNYAKLLEKLKIGQAKTIAFDIFFPEKSGKIYEDKAFAESIYKNQKKIILAAQYSVKEELDENLKIKNKIEIVQKPFALLWEAIGKSNNRLGIVSIEEGKDGIVRKAKLWIEENNLPYLSFDLQVISNYLNIPQKEFKINLRENILKIGKTKIKFDNRREVFINYGFKYLEKSESLSKYEEDFLAQHYMDIISLKDVLSMSKEDLLSFFKDKLVLIGTTATAAYDNKATPVGIMPGVYIHANFIFDLLEGKFIYPIKFKYFTLWILFLGILMGLILPYFTPRQGIVFSLLLSYLIIQFSYLFFKEKGIIIQVFPAHLNVLLCFITVNIYHYQSEQAAKKRLSGLFQEFAPLPSSILDEIISGSSKGADLGGQKVNLTILFSDIRGYTDLSEKLDPITVMNTLNEYHTIMGEVFERNGAVIFDYQGDAQMVVFGLIPPSKGKHAFYAVKSALEMQEKLKILREKWQNEGKHTFEIGVGVCTGDVSLGIVGSAQRKQYAAIGDSTNVAARLQGLSRELQSSVLISESTYLASRDYLEVDVLSPVKLKGKSEPLQVYRVKGIKNA